MLAHLGLARCRRARTGLPIAGRCHGGLRIRPGRRTRRTTARFCRERLKRKLIARDAGRRCRATGAWLTRLTREPAAMAQAPIGALCQSVARGHTNHPGPAVFGRAAAPACHPPVCGRRAFYGLMTLDETGVLCVRATRRSEAERDPLHPIRVIPAREVSGSRLVFHSPPGSVRHWMRLLPGRPRPPVSSLGTCACCRTERIR